MINNNSPLISSVYLVTTVIVSCSIAALVLLYYALKLILSSNKKGRPSCDSGLSNAKDQNNDGSALFHVASKPLSTNIFDWLTKNRRMQLKTQEINEDKLENNIQDVNTADNGESLTENSTWHCDNLNPKEIILYLLSSVDWLIKCCFCRNRPGKDDKDNESHNILPQGHFGNRKYTRGSFFRGYLQFSVELNVPPMIFELTNQDYYNHSQLKLEKNLGTVPNARFPDYELPGVSKSNEPAFILISPPSDGYECHLQVAVHEAWKLSNRFLLPGGSSMNLTTAILVGLEEVPVEAGTTRARTSYVDLDARENDVDDAFNLRQLKAVNKKGSFTVPFLPWPKPNFHDSNDADDDENHMVSSYARTDSGILTAVSPTINDKYYHLNQCYTKDHVNTYSTNMSDKRGTINYRFKQIVDKCLAKAYKLSSDGGTITAINCSESARIHDQTDIMPPYNPPALSRFKFPTIQEESLNQGSEPNDRTVATSSSPCILSENIYLTHRVKRSYDPIFNDKADYRVPILTTIVDSNHYRLMESLRNRLITEIPENTNCKILRSTYCDHWLANAVQSKLDTLELKFTLLTKTKIGGLCENGDIIVNLGKLFNGHYSTSVLFTFDNSHPETTDTNTPINRPSLESKSYDTPPNGSPKLSELVNMSPPSSPKTLDNKQSSRVTRKSEGVCRIDLTKKLSFQSRSKGQILLTLRYLPTSGRLQISFDQIRNVQFPFFVHDIQGLYVKVALCIDRKLVTIIKSPVYPVIPRIQMYQISTTKRGVGVPSSSYPSYSKLHVVKSPTKNSSTCNVYPPPPSLCSCDNSNYGSMSTGTSTKGGIKTYSVPGILQEKSQDPIGRTHTITAKTTAAAIPDTKIISTNCDNNTDIDDSQHRSISRVGSLFKNRFFHTSTPSSQEGSVSSAVIGIESTRNRQKNTLGDSSNYSTETISPRLSLNTHYFLPYYTFKDLSSSSSSSSGNEDFPQPSLKNPLINHVNGNVNMVDKKSSRIWNLNFKAKNVEATEEKSSFRKSLSPKAESDYLSYNKRKGKPQIQKAARGYKKRPEIEEGSGMSPRKTMTFLLDPAEYKKATVFVSLSAMDPMNSVRFFRKFSVGSVILGLTGGTAGREHWEQILKQLRDPVSKWHDLV